MLNLRATRNPLDEMRIFYYIRMRLLALAWLVQMDRTSPS